MSTFYFSTSGDDTTGSGTEASPWRNFWAKKSSANALSGGDICKFKRGDIWSGGSGYVQVDSSGTAWTAGNFITLDAYGDVAKPKPCFTTASIISGFTHAGGNIYTKTISFTDPFTIGVGLGTASGNLPVGYGLYGLCIWKGTTTTLPAGTWKVSAGVLYIHLHNDANPSSYTIWAPSSYQFDQYRGIVRGGKSGSVSRGKYVEIRNIRTMFASGVGMSFGQDHGRFRNCESLGNGREGFYYASYPTSAGTGGPEISSDCEAYDCVGTYNNCRGNGYGQGYTSNSSRTWYINCLATRNYQAGFDFLGASYTGTFTRNGGMVYCTSYKNGQNPNTSESNDGSVYLDCPDNILIYGCKIHGSGIGAQTNNVSTTKVSNESPSYTNVSNIYYVNNLIYDGSYYIVDVDNNISGSGTPTLTGIKFINNTIIKTNSSGGAGVGFFRDLTTSGLELKNNIFVKETGTTAIFPFMSDGEVGTNAAYIDADYNLYYNAGATSTIVTYGGSNKTFAQWQASPYSKEAHGVNSNPLFNNDNPPTWVTSHQYRSRDYVINAGTVYLCVYDHTSGTFATDLANYLWESVSVYRDVTLNHTADTLNPKGSNSPAVAAGLTTPWTPPSWIATAGVLSGNGAVVGSTRTDGQNDASGLDMGFHYYNADAPAPPPNPTGFLTSTNVQPASLVLSTTNTATISFTTQYDWPSTGKLVITFPTTLGAGFSFDSGGTSTAAFTVGGSGSLAVAYTTNVVTLTRSGGSTITGGTAVTLTLSNVQNPNTVGTTGAYQLKTTDSAGALIDIDTNVSADQIISAASGFVTITISGVTLANVRILTT